MDLERYDPMSERFRSKTFSLTYLCPGFDLHLGEKDAYECHSTTKIFLHKRLKYDKFMSRQIAFTIFKHFSV